MVLKGYRLWVMGQLDSTCRAPPRERAYRPEQSVAPALAKYDAFLAQKVVEVINLDEGHLFVGFFRRLELLLEVSRTHDGPFVAHLVRALVEREARV
jgi:hypothetical protein